MKLDYEYYGSYDENAGDKVNLELHIRLWLQEMELMFDYIKKNKADILESFLERVESKYLSEFEGKFFELAEVGFDRLLEDKSLGSNSHFN